MANGYRCTLTTITVAVLAVIGIEAGVLLYTPQDAHDPDNVSMVRQALTANGINPNGVRIKSIYTRGWGIGTSYKATYVDSRGRTCHIHFRNVFLRGVQPLGSPSCDYREIGYGEDSIQGRIAVKPAFDPSYDQTETELEIHV